MVKKFIYPVFFTGNVADSNAVHRKHRKKSHPGGGGLFEFHSDFKRNLLLFFTMSYTFLDICKTTFFYQLQYYHLFRLIGQQYAIIFAWYFYMHCDCALRIYVRFSYLFWISLLKVTEIYRCQTQRCDQMNYVLCSTHIVFCTLVCSRLPLLYYMQ